MNMKPTAQSRAQWGINQTRADLRAARELIAQLEDQVQSLENRKSQLELSLEIARDNQKLYNTLNSRTNKRLGIERRIASFTAEELPPEFIAKVEAISVLGFVPVLLVSFTFDRDNNQQLFLELAACEEIKH
jgi:chromosome segregation ATPase